MSGGVLFPLDAARRWRLAYDDREWIVERRKGTSRHSERGSARKSRWQAVSFIASEKRVLHRVLAQRGVHLTPDARARMAALPERFADWRPPRLSVCAARRPQLRREGRRYG